MVNGVARVYLIIDDKNMNDLLLEKNLAERCDEDFVSKVN